MNLNVCLSDAKYNFSQYFSAAHLFPSNMNDGISYIIFNDILNSTNVSGFVWFRFFMLISDFEMIPKAHIKAWPLSGIQIK